jgi:GDP-4-dehydro-6-deoxy-D-mannose reductase
MRSNRPAGRQDAAGSYLPSGRQLHGRLRSRLAVNADSARHFSTLRAARVADTLGANGSAAEYGIVEPSRTPSRSHVLRPVSPYGVTKAYQTLIAGFYAHQHGVDVVVARLFN